MATRNLFVSYSRHDGDRAHLVSGELQRLGSVVWLDQQLSGGQQWWDTILQQIRTCDCLVFLISDVSLQSRACLAELDYAHALGKPILPIAVTAKIHDALLPPYLVETHRLQFGSGGGDATYELAKAMLSLPLPPPIPEHLPDPPRVPTSYLDELGQTVTGPSLDRTTQVNLVAELKQRLVIEHERDAAIALLELLQRRSDLYASVAADINDVLVRASSAVPPPSSPMPPPPPPPSAPRAVSSPPKPPAPRRAGVLVACSMAGLLLVGGGGAAALVLANDDPIGATTTATTVATTTTPTTSPTTVPPTPPTTPTTSATTPTTSPTTVPPTPPATPPSTEAPPDLAAAVATLKGACSAGDAEACDTLVTGCMGAVDGVCEALYEASPSGSLAEAVALCGMGTLAGCDSVYWAANVGSDLEYFGSTCGYRTSEMAGYCGDSFD